MCLYAYCLMPNHVHMLVQTSEPALDEFFLLAHERASDSLDAGLGPSGTGMLLDGCMGHGIHIEI
jgi:hypothetical protein